MNIVVCVKQIQDPEIPSAKFRLDPTSQRVIPPEGIPPVINPYDAHAVELALRFREQYDGKITILTLDGNGEDKVVKYALSMGADDGIILSDKAFEGSDGFSTAHILIRALQKIGDYDVILCGRQAADWDEGLTGSLIACALDLPLVTLAKSMAFEEDKLIVTRVMLNGFQRFAVSLPAVVSVSSEVGSPRLPSGWGIISAARRQIPVWSSHDIAADPLKLGTEAALRRLVRLFIPERERKCDIISAENAPEAAAKLIDGLQKIGVI